MGAKFLENAEGMILFANAEASAVSYEFHYIASSVCNITCHGQMKETHIDLSLVFCPIHNKSASHAARTAYLQNCWQPISLSYRSFPLLPLSSSFQKAMADHEINLEWVDAIVRDPDAQAAGKQIVKERPSNLLAKSVFPNTKSGFIFCFGRQDLLADVEVKARTAATSSFLIWPKNGQKEEKEEIPKLKGKKTKKAGSLSVKLNVQFLLPFVGHSTLHKQLGHVDFVTHTLYIVNNAWKATGSAVWIFFWACCFFSRRILVSW